MLLYMHVCWESQSKMLWNNESSSCSSRRDLCVTGEHVVTNASCSLIKLIFHLLSQRRQCLQFTATHYSITVLIPHSIRCHTGCYITDHPSLMCIHYFPRQLCCWSCFGRYVCLWVLFPDGREKFGINLSDLRIKRIKFFTVTWKKMSPTSQIGWGGVN